MLPVAFQELSCRDPFSLSRCCWRCHQPPTERYRHWRFPPIDRFKRFQRGGLCRPLSLGSCPWEAQNGTKLLSGIKANMIKLYIYIYQTDVVSRTRWLTGSRHSRRNAVSICQPSCDILQCRFFCLALVGSCQDMSRLQTDSGYFRSPGLHFWRPPIARAARYSAPHWSGDGVNGQFLGLQRLQPSDWKAIAVTKKHCSWCCPLVVPCLSHLYHLSSYSQCSNQDLERQIETVGKLASKPLAFWDASHRYKRDH